MRMDHESDAVFGATSSSSSSRRSKQVASTGAQRVKDSGIVTSGWNPSGWVKVSHHYDVSGWGLRIEDA